MLQSYDEDINTGPVFWIRYIDVFVDITLMVYVSQYMLNIVQKESRDTYALSQHATF